MAYDAGSRITGVTDRMGLTEGYTYDPQGNTIAVKVRTESTISRS